MRHLRQTCDLFLSLVGALGLVSQVTRVSVREARAAELKAEIVNSQKLAGYFKENAGVYCKKAFVTI